MTMEIVPFKAGLGADIVGIDVRKKATEEDQRFLRNAWGDFLVLRIREQPMTDEEHMAFSRIFGSLDLNPTAVLARDYGVKVGEDNSSKIPPEIGVVSNVVEDGKLIGDLGSGEAAWHTDSSFLDSPPAGSALRALEVPPSGGDTHFLNMYKAYDTLSDSLKQQIDGRVAVHSSTHKSDGTVRPGFENIVVKDPNDMPGARHPLVRTHPYTGRKALFLGRRLGAFVVGLSFEESEALLDKLWTHSLQDQFTWTQRWKVGDLVIWDNRCTMHRRDSFDASARRIMHRTQIAGDRPF